MTLWCQGDLKKVIIHNCNLFCFEIAMMVHKYSIDLTVKFLHHVKNSTEEGDFLRFYDYLCHVIDDFTCFELQH